MAKLYEKLKPLSLEEIEQMRLYGFKGPNDFPRFALTARLAHQMRQTLEARGCGEPDCDCGRYDDTITEALKLWEDHENG